MEQKWKITYPSLLSLTIPQSKLLEPILLLHSQIRKLLNLGLIEPIHNRVLSLRNMYAFDLANM
jgi:hypothetical protein